MLARLEQDRVVYLQHMDSFKHSYGVVLKQGHALIGTLSDEELSIDIFAESREDIEGSWTTAGLMAQHERAVRHIRAAGGDKILELRDRDAQLRRRACTRNSTRSTASPSSRRRR